MMRSKASQDVWLTCKLEQVGKESFEKIYFDVDCCRTVVTLQSWAHVQIGKRVPSNRLMIFAWKKNKIENEKLFANKPKRTKFWISKSFFWEIGQIGQRLLWRDERVGFEHRSVRSVSERLVFALQGGRLLRRISWPYTRHSMHWTVSGRSSATALGHQAYRQWRLNFEYDFFC